MTPPRQVRLGERRSAPLPRRHTALYSAIESELRPAGDAVLVAGSSRLGATMLGAALSLALLAPAEPLQAATITVDSDTVVVATDGDCTLPEAVANANAGADTTGGDCVPGEPGLDTIEFDAALSGSVITLDDFLLVLDPLSIAGPGRDDLTIESISGGGMIRALEALEVSGLEFRYGSAEFGGAIAAAADLRISASRFRYNRATFGGAVFAGEKYDGPRSEAGSAKGIVSRQVTIDDVEFLYNDAYAGAAPFGAGGAMAVFFGQDAGSAPALSVTNSQFRGNGIGSEPREARGGKYSPGFGGALFAVSEPAGPDFTPTTGIEGTSFYNNDAMVGGGAFLAVPSITIDGGEFLYNDADYAGGGVAVAACKYGCGGAQPRPDARELARLAVDDGSLSINGTEFRYNQAGRGGGLSVYASTVDIQGAAFVRNRAEGLPYGDRPDAVRAPSRGGAPFCSPDGPEGDGGGLLARVETSVVIGGATRFDENCAADSGGGASFGLEDDATFAMDATTEFTENFSYDDGGGLSLFANTASVVTVAGSFSNNVAYFGDGGGAYIVASGAPDVTIADASFNDNYARYYGGGLFIGTNPRPGDAARGSVTLRDSELIGNVADDGRGGGASIGIYGSAYDLVDLGASVLVSDVTISGNRADDEGGGILIGGSEIGDVEIIRATFAENSSDDVGGGLSVDLGDDDDETVASFAFIDSTVSGNVAATAGGLWLNFGLEPGGLARLQNSTIDGNSTGIFRSGDAAARGGNIPYGSGGGIVLIGDDFEFDFVTLTGNTTEGDGGGLVVGSGSTVAVRNSIIAGNGASGAGPDIFGSVDADFTLIQDASGATVNGANNDIGSDPLLGPLADNGGPTRTRLPLDASPAIDSGDPAFAPPPAQDQRGAGFPRVDPVVGIADKGAVETQGVVVVDVTTLTIAPDPFAEGTPSTLTVTTSAAAPADVLVTIDFTGIAGLGTDFTAEDDDAGTAGIQVRVPTGTSSGSIQLQAIADAIDEPDEPFTATVAAVVGANLPAPLSDSATITDADATPTVTISLGDTELAEGESTTIIATLSGPSDQDVTVTLTFSGQANFGSDYSTGDADPGTPGIQIVVPAGATSASIALNALNDAASEPNESIIVEIQSVTNGTAGGGAATTGIITGSGGTTVPVPSPAVIPTLSEWMLMLLALLLPASVITRLRGQGSGARKR